MRQYLTLAFSCLTLLSFGQAKITTTGNNVVNTSDPYAADIVIGSDAGTRHDASIMFWSNFSASRIFNVGETFYMSTFNSVNSNIGLAAATGGSSYFLGNLGIGTTNPNAQLSLGNGILPQKLLMYDNNDHAKLGFGVQPFELRMFAPDDAHISFGTVALTDGNTWSEKMRISNSGNVGIGTNNPQSKLHIDAPLDNSVTALTIGNGNATGDLTVPYGAPTGGYNIDFKTWRDVVPDQVGARIRAERINNHLPNSALVQGVDLTFSTSPGFERNQLTERLRINHDGNIGIGTTDPKGYKLAVAGSAIAESVTIKLQGNWPDYVFNPAYNLPPLSDVKTYIDKNQHLPDIPSEAEVVKDGVNLGEMNKLLVKKVEELTLYLIQQNKKLEQQQIQIDKLSKVLIK
jgi:hypothetical protein